MFSLKSLIKKFESLYDASPSLGIKSPGRINIIGEHTDYNAGFVLPFAIDKSIYVIARANNTNTINCFAYDMDESLKISLSELNKKTDSGWGTYIMLILQMLQKNKDAIQGMDIVFGGDLPIGAGVSSSSALTCGIIACFNLCYDLGLSKTELVEYASIAENGTGVRGGKMDQNAIVHSKEGTALFLDCQNGNYKYISIPNDDQYKWVLFDTKVKHKLLDSDYNLRREQCDLALATINNKLSLSSNFRALSKKHLDVLSSMVLKNRLSHYLDENQRVLSMVKALEKNDFKMISDLLSASHESLSKLYEVSCPELDFIVSELKTLGYGARMMGGGFGGCVISYLPKANLNTIEKEISKSYLKQFQINPDIFSASPSRGLNVAFNYL